MRLNQNQFFCLVIFGLLSAGCGASNVEKSAAAKEAVPVRVIKVERKALQNILDYVGNVKAQEEAFVYPKVSGKIIEKLKEEGSRVSKGETLVYIDRDEVGFQFEKAPVESPLTGIVGRVNVDIGTSVTPQTAVALVVGYGPRKDRIGYSGKISVHDLTGAGSQDNGRGVSGRKIYGKGL